MIFVKTEYLYCWEQTVLILDKPWPFYSFSLHLLITLIGPSPYTPWTSSWLLFCSWLEKYWVLTKTFDPILWHIALNIDCPLHLLVNVLNPMLLIHIRIWNYYLYHTFLCLTKISRTTKQDKQIFPKTLKAVFKNIQRSIVPQNYIIQQISD